MEILSFPLPHAVDSVFGIFHSARRIFDLFVDSLLSSILFVYLHGGRYYPGRGHKHKKSMWNRLLQATLAAIFLFIWSVPARAQDSGEPEVIPLIAVDSYATTALWVHVFVDYFIPEVDRRLAATGNYQVRWNKAFGGTIAKTRGVLDSLQYDLADIGIITSPFHPDKIPFW